MGEGKVDLIGGGMNKDENHVESGEDIYQNFVREMKEEAGIGESHISSLEGIGILHSPKSNVLILGIAKLKISADELLEVFPRKVDEEMQNLVFVERGRLNSFLSTLGAYRPLIMELLE